MPLDDMQPDAPHERQRFARRSVLVAAELQLGDRRITVDILDISEGGAKIRAPEEIDVGTAVGLLVEGVGLFASQVAWRSGESHGIEFLANPEAVAADLPQIIESSDDERERRRHVRTTVLWKAEIYWGIRRAECEVLNYSVSGARIRVAAEIKDDAEVTLRSIRFGEQRGKVIWREGDRFGIEFLFED